jgi:hypothetical protein
MSSITCTSQANIAIENHRASQEQICGDPHHQADVDAWVKGKVCSCGCGRPATTPHHPDLNVYGTEEYHDLSLCEPYYWHCHKMLHKGFVRCPECSGWMRPGHEMCSKCRGVTKATRRRHNRHPCPKNRGSQKCAFAWAPVCSYSPKRALECNWYAEHMKGAKV